MKERKFREQFSVTSRWNDVRQREEGTAEYTGDYYRFPDGRAGAKRLGRRAGTCCVLFWGMALLYLKTARATSGSPYALMPLLLSLFPGTYALMGLFTVMRAPERMTVVQREKGIGRLLRSSAGAMALSFLAAAGCLIRILTLPRGLPAGSRLEFVPPLICGLSMLAAFRRCRGAWHAIEVVS